LAASQEETENISGEENNEFVITIVNNGGKHKFWNAQAVLMELEDLWREHIAFEAQVNTVEGAATGAAEEEAVQKEVPSNNEINETTAEADQQRNKRRRSLTELAEEPPEKREAVEVNTEKERSSLGRQENLETVEVDPLEPGRGEVHVESSDHIKKVHKKKKNFTCKRCSKGFRTNGGLKNHLKTHRCGITNSDEYFARKIDRKQHQSHHPKLDIHMPDVHQEVVLKNNFACQR
jgi:hypothetical protein